MAHFAITDVPGNKFRSFERLERGAAGLAGASIDPVYHVWLEDWSVTGDGEGSTHLSAREENLSLDLTLVESKPPVLQGDAGLSQKGAQPGNASYYYSLTRLESTGTLQLEGGKEFAVKGLSWMDHEFSTSALSHGQIGWDWFALQLSDGQDLMVFNLRQADGAPDPYSSGSLISADGMKTTLSRQDFTINPLRSWVSSYSQARYPSGWQVDVPEAGISLEITPLLEDQENRLTYTYWEGAVAINGTVAGSPVSGYGYVELTGYAASMQGEF
jgi:predicted secreted hydrolase